MGTMVAEGVMIGVVDMVGMAEEMVGMDIMDGEAVMVMTDSYFSGIFEYICMKALTMPKDQNNRDSETFAVVFRDSSTYL